MGGFRGLLVESGRKELPSTNAGPRVSELKLEESVLGSRRYSIEMERKRRVRSVEGFWDEGGLVRRGTRV